MNGNFKCNYNRLIKGKDIEDYKILIDRNNESLQKQVNDYLKKGYLLAGGVSTLQGNLNRGTYEWTSTSKSFTTHVEVRFVQAVYKTSKEYFTKG